MKERNWKYLAISVLICAVVGFTKTGGWDIWWHLLTGKIAWDGTLDLARDPFSFTYFGEPWHYKDLLADILLYAGFNTFHFAWFAVLKGAVVASLAFCIGYYSRRRGMLLAPAALVLGLVVAAVQYRIIERPIVFSLMIYPIFILALKEAFSSASFVRRIRWSAATVGVLGVWCFIHRAALIGFPIVLLYGYSSWLLGRIEKKSATDSTGHQALSFLLPGGIVVGCGLLSLAHPEGMRLWTTALQVAGSAELKTHISEWARLTPLELMSDFPWASSFIAIGLVYCLVDTAQLYRRQKRFGCESAIDLVVLAVLVTLVLSSVRYIPYGAVYAAFPVSRFAHRLYKLLPVSLLRYSRLAAYLASVVIVVATNRFPVGLGEMNGRYPAGAITFAREAALDGPVMNAFHLAGYTLWHLWPSVHVLVDGRNDTVYPPEFVVRALRSGRDEETFEELSSGHLANWVLASNDVNQPTHLFLADHPDWSLVYWSEEGLIYTRRGQYPHLDEQRYRHIDPRSVDRSVFRAMKQSRRDIAAELGQELKRMLHASPDSKRALAASALYFHFLGPESHATRNALIEQLSRLKDGAEIAEQLRSKF